MVRFAAGGWGFAVFPDAIRSTGAVMIRSDDFFERSCFW